MEQQPRGGFAALDLSPQMLAALEAANYQEPTPIQAGLIPLALEEKDIVGQARTGTGKTAAFAIPILELLDPDHRGKDPQALILVPTRELAVQVKDEVVKLSRGQGARCVAVYGGTPLRGQIAKLQRGVDIIVGTPGRVLDHLCAAHCHWTTSTASCWMKPTACSTSAFAPTWRRSCAAAPASGRRCC